MKILPTISPLLAVLCICTISCRKPVNEQAMESGKLAETLACWDQVREITQSGHGIEAFKEEFYSEWSSDDLLSLCQDLAEGEQERAAKLSRIPFLHVDPALSDYVVGLSDYHARAASGLGGLIVMLKKEKEITGGDRFLYGLIGNLIERRNEKDGVLFNSFVDQLGTTMNEVESIKPALAELDSQFRSLAETRSGLLSGATRVRVEMTRKYEREFSPFDDAVPNARSFPVDKILTEDQIKNYLIGRPFGDGLASWEFETKEEFVSLKITGTKRISDEWIAYEVSTRGRGWFSGMERDFKLLLMFKTQITRLKLTEVKLVP